MKKTSTLLFGLLLISLFSFSQPQPKVENIVIVTIDGCRWQEVFRGADSSLLFNDKFKKTEAGRLTSRYWATTDEARREKLMPFLWSTISTRGRIYGNRKYGNLVSVRNKTNISYPGYSEIFTGYADPQFRSNAMVYNQNTSLFAFLNTLPGFKDKVASFASWDRVMGYLNAPENDFMINGGYEEVNVPQPTPLQSTLNNLQKLYHRRESSRPDYITYLQAKEYLRLNHPKALSIGFAWTDDMAHDGSYPLYLDKIFTFDNMIQDLWEYLQSDPQYKDRTALLITVDHGRGTGDRWTSHGKNIPGSNQMWFALISPGVEAKGEMKTAGKYYQEQLAQTMAHLLGFNFKANHPVANAIQDLWR